MDSKERKWEAFIRTTMPGSAAFPNVNVNGDGAPPNATAMKERNII